MKMEQTTDLSVRKQITVEAPRERAFEVFTEGFASWWPLDTHHIGTKAAVTVVMEPRTGGRWFERAADGSECDWGRVTDWQPPERVLLAWMLDPEWHYDPDPAHATELEIRFVALDPTTTRVELEHRGFEIWGEAGEAMSKSVGSDEGWSGLLETYAKAVLDQR
jgi:uncharacterized protein YndB with AHSA1/START domain